MGSTSNMSMGSGATASTPELAVWWYKREGQSHGPVAPTQLQSFLGQGVVDRSTLIWREDFGQHWKRFDETNIWRQEPKPAGPPSADYGRWSKSFAKSENKPKRIQYSLLGFFLGPLYYFYLRMWAKGLVLLACYFTIALVVAFAHDLSNTPSSPFSSLIISVYCGSMAKRDYYRFRVLGEKIWPWLRRFNNLWVLSGINLLVLCGAIFFILDNDADVLVSDFSGTWKGGSLTLLIHTEGQHPYINFGKGNIPVKITSMDTERGILVVTPMKGNGKPLTMRKKIESDDPKGYTLDFYVADDLVGNFDFLRPD